MSTRSNLRPNPVIVDGDMSGSITSEPTILQSLTVGSYTYSWSGTTPVGEISIQASNDYALNQDGTVRNAGTWVTLYFTLDGSTVVDAAPVSGNTGTGIIEFSTGAYAIRTVYTRDSGIGTLQSVISGKVA